MIGKGKPQAQKKILMIIVSCMAPDKNGGWRE
jgi:hypothetical protein